jgi:hypothetical protein
MSTPAVQETTTTAAAADKDETATTTVHGVVPHRAAIPSRSETPLVNDNDDLAVEEGAAEEDALFSQMEQTTTEQEQVQQPRDVQAAPKLLQQALQAGQVQPSDSEQESDHEEPTKAEAEAAKAAKQPHVHPRVCIYVA